jgi:hypothetical protein
MATTTNYSWTTPDDTALVKDGAAAIRSLGTAIDTTVFNNASAAIAKTIVDAKGDLIAATAADTVSRLAVGANNTVLTADSTTATGLKWATPSGSSASYTLINAGGTSLTGAATITVSGISGYDNFLVCLSDASSASSASVFGVRINGDTATNYNHFGGMIIASSTYNMQIIDRSNQLLATNTTMIPIAQMAGAATSVSAGSVQIRGGNGTGLKSFISTGGTSNSGGANPVGVFLQGYYTSSSTISSISVFSNTGNFDAGTLFVYGSVA